ncbi:hypothetical protein EVAR_47689_1 [Eumeta japonica]|uniref:Uncharacterized protein n=1 Tax=Eumeta variegata TaxID=151549 RepID=A0A4C1XNP6_EUMVA|nr:hypothetical protein EVAR_47689_1 [Eumeta japonica]
MPNITTWVGVIPFILVAVLDTFKWGSDIAFYLHLVFSFLDVMYIPYAIIYYVDRVYMRCNLHGHFTEPTLSSYFTAEIWVLLAAMVVHVPLCSAALLAADRLKSERRICSKTQPPPPSAPDVEAEFSEAGEDEDVRRERRRASALLQNPSETPPALIVHNLRKEYKVRGTGEGGCCGGGDEGARKAGLARLSLVVDGGEVFGMLAQRRRQDHHHEDHNGRGKTHLWSLCRWLQDRELVSRATP